MCISVSIIFDGKVFLRLWVAGKLPRQCLRSSTTPVATICPVIAFPASPNMHIGNTAFHLCHQSVHKPLGHRVRGIAVYCVVLGNQVSYVLGHLGGLYKLLAISHKSNKKVQRIYQLVPLSTPPLGPVVKPGCHAAVRVVQKRRRYPEAEFDVGID